MDNAPTTSGDAREVKIPVWRRMATFPLVALFLGLLAFGIMSAFLAFLAYGFASVMGIERIQDMPDWFSSYLRPILATVGSILVLKLAIRHFVAEKRDDLPFDGRSRDFLTGIAFAAILMSLVVGIAAVLGGYRVSGWGGSTSLGWLLLAAGFKAAFFEEILFRGVIFRFLEEFAGSWIALILSAILFGFLHHNNPNATLFTTLAIAIQAGVLLGGAYMLTRNLWFAIGLHWGWNVTQGYIWDVSVSGIPVDGMLEAHPAGNALISGGTFGLEASIIATVLVTAAGIWMIAKAKQLDRIVEPWWVRREQGLKLPDSTGRLSRSLLAAE